MSDWLSPAAISEVTRALDLAGVFANGLLGGVLARGRELDLYGFLVIGVISGLGGGILIAADQRKLLRRLPVAALGLQVAGQLVGRALQQVGHIAVALDLLEQQRSARLVALGQQGLGLQVDALLPLLIGILIAAGL